MAQTKAKATEASVDKKVPEQLVSDSVTESERRHG